MIKKGLLIVSPKSHPHELSLYGTKIEEKKIKIFYSAMQTSWTRAGKIAYSLENTGDGFIFKDVLTKEIINLDYCQAEMLQVAFKLLKEDQYIIEHLIQK